MFRLNMWQSSLDMAQMPIWYQNDKPQKLLASWDRHAWSCKAAATDAVEHARGQCLWVCDGFRRVYFRNAPSVRIFSWDAHVQLGRLRLEQNIASIASEWGRLWWTTEWLVGDTSFETTRSRVTSHPLRLLQWHSPGSVVSLSTTAPTPCAVAWHFGTYSCWGSPPFHAARYDLHWIERCMSTLNISYLIFHFTQHNVRNWS